MNTQVAHRGVAIEFGEQILIVPPLTTWQLENFADKLDLLSSPKKDFSFKTWGKFLRENMVPVTKAALLRNYPDMTDEQVSDLVNTENYPAILNAFLGLSHSDKVRVGEPFPAVMPGSPTSTPLPVSAGVESAPASPSTPDGPGATSLKM